MKPTRTTINFIRRCFSKGGASVLNTKGTGITGTSPNSSTVDFHYKDFDHLEFWSSNPKQTAIYYSSLFGFEIKESQDIYSRKETSKYYLQNGNVRFLISGPSSPNNSSYFKFLERHGDTVKGVGLKVDDVNRVKNHLINRGYENIEVIEDMENGIKHFEIPMFGSISHSFIERNGDRAFWEGLQVNSESLAKLNTINTVMNNNGNIVPEFKRIDHVGFPQEIFTSNSVLEKYYKDLGFHMFWYIDEKAISSKQSSLKSTVVSDFDHKVRFPIFEPVEKRKKSQIQEFLDFNGGPGAQHIAIEVDDILTTVKAMRNRGVEFLPCNDSYYSLISDKLNEFDVILKEDFNQIKEQNILVDFDAEGNYLLQIFTKPVLDRPTLFIEFIQREGHQGFGEGNFNRLFLSIEEEQKKRGNLI